MHGHEPEHYEGQYEDVLGVEPEHKVVKPAAEHGVAYGWPYHRDGVGQGCGYADGKLGALAEYDVVPRERLEYGHGPEYDARNPQDFVADLVAPAKVLVVHVQYGQEDHCVRAVVVYVAYVEAVRNLVVNELDAVPCPVQDWLVVEHQQGARNAEYDKDDEREHAEEPERADKPSRKRELYRGEYGAVNAVPHPVQEGHKARAST